MKVIIGEPRADVVAASKNYEIGYGPKHSDFVRWGTERVAESTTVDPRTLRAGTGRLLLLTVVPLRPDRCLVKAIVRNPQTERARAGGDSCRPDLRLLMGLEAARKWAGVCYV